MTGDAVILSDDQHLELSRIAQSRSLPAGYVFRARLILMLEEGASYNAIKLRLGTTPPTLGRLDPVLPLSPGRIERHGFEYRRHGTLSLFAALETATGRVHGKTTARHTCQDFVTFLEQVVAQCSARQQIHVILDHLSAHKIRLVNARLVHELLSQNSRVHFHFTPTYASWIHQVQL